MANQWFFGVSGFVGMPHFRCMAKLLGYQVQFAVKIPFLNSLINTNFINLSALIFVIKKVKKLLSQ